MSAYPSLSEQEIVSIKNAMNYDPETGKLTWAIDVFGGKTKGWKVAAAGDEAGTVSNFGYRRITVKGKQIVGHRAAWLIHYGVNPPSFVDHINGDRSDNRIANLRLATKAQNGFNKGKSKANTSGWKGVYLHRSTGLWTSRIRVNGRTISLGYYREIKAAAEAYILAALEYHGEYARFE